jgi:hypothetical protein
MKARGFARALIWSSTKTLFRSLKIWKKQSASVLD